MNEIVGSYLGRGRTGHRLFWQSFLFLLVVVVADAVVAVDVLDFDLLYKSLLCLKRLLHRETQSGDRMTHTHFFQRWGSLIWNIFMKLQISCTLYLDLNLICCTFCKSKCILFKSSPFCFDKFSSLLFLYLFQSIYLALTLSMFLFLFHSTFFTSVLFLFLFSSLCFDFSFVSLSNSECTFLMKHT